MNKTKLTKLERIKQKCRFNLTKIDDLIRWCGDYKIGKVDTVGQIMGVFTLKYDDVVFVIENLEEIKTILYRYNCIWCGEDYERSSFEQTLCCDKCFRKSYAATKANYKASGHRYPWTIDGRLR